MRRRGSFLTGRGYDNPEIAAVKFGLAEDIQRAVARQGGPTQAEVAARVRAAGVPLSQPDVSAILNGNVRAFALERLIQVAAALRMTEMVRPCCAVQAALTTALCGTPGSRQS